MVKGDINFKGFTNLAQKLDEKANLKDIKEVVQLNTAELQEGMQKRASFKGHYEGKNFVKPTGTTKRSIGIDMQDGGFRGVVGPRTEYAPYLEYGTRFMAAQPFIRPSFFVQKYKFIKDIKRLMR